MKEPTGEATLSISLIMKWTVLFYRENHPDDFPSAQWPLHKFATAPDAAFVSMICVQTLGRFLLPLLGHDGQQAGRQADIRKLTNN